MTWAAIVLLAVIATQLYGLGMLLRRQIGMIQAASDLNLEAQGRLFERVKEIERRLARLPSAESWWDRTFKSDKP